MAKRRADKEISRDDPFGEEVDIEEEEPTGSAFASPEVLSTRKIAKARRSIQSPAGGTGTQQSLFSGISLTPSGGSSLAAPSFPSSSRLAFGGTNLFGSSATTTTATMNGLSSIPTRVNGSAESEVKSRSPEFYAKVRALNDKFMSHLNRHHQQNPEENFTDNCQEYLNYYQKLERDYPVIEQPTSSVSTKTFGPSPQEQAKMNSSPTSNESPFLTSTPVQSNPPFGLPKAVPKFTGFNLPTSQPSSFGSSVASSSQPASADGDDEDHVPPKVEDAKTDEEGSIYSKRTKVYFLKEVNDGKRYEAMGKGVLHIKKLESGKYQLLVRGENAVGTLFVNIILASELPIKQVKKDVTLVAITKNPATPTDNTPTSVSFLLRCATEADAADLAGHLDKFKEMSC